MEKNIFEGHLFENRLTGEQWMCIDIARVQKIDGVDFVAVHRRGETRYFLIRKASLKRVTNQSCRVKNNRKQYSV